MIDQLTSTANGPTRFFGTLDKPANVTVDGEPAQLRTIDHQGGAVHTFEAWLQLADGIHEIPVTATDGNQNTATKTYEVTVAGGTSKTLAYDLNGNLISRTAGSEVTTYDWDANNQLIRIHYPDGGKTEFVYDGLGRRVQIIEKDATDTVTDHRRFIWDGMTIIEERDGVTNAVVKRFFDHGIEIVTGPDAGDYFTTFDHLGSIREVVDASETVITRYDYDPYGNVEKVFGSVESDFLFTGHFHHARSGLHLAPFRAYDPELGRWLSRDPLYMAELLPEGPNLYRYVGNNPIQAIDPTGEFLIAAIVAVTAVGVAYGAYRVARGTKKWLFRTISG